MCRLTKELNSIVSTFGILEMPVHSASSVYINHELVVTASMFKLSALLCVVTTCGSEEVLCYREPDPCRPEEYMCDGIVDCVLDLGQDENNCEGK